MIEETAGLQAERTILAHWRTALATVVVSLLLVRQAASGVERVVAALIAGAAVVVATVAMVRRQRGLLAGDVAASPWTVAAVTAAVVSLQVGALVVVL